MTELFNVFVHGLEMVRDVRLNGFLGEIGGDKPKQAVFWRSGATVVSIRANLRGMRTLFDVSGLAGRLPADSGWIAQSIGFEFDTAEGMLDIAAGPIVEVLARQEQAAGPCHHPAHHVASVGTLRRQARGSARPQRRLLLARR